MFGHRYFGQRYFGDSYFGDGGVGSGPVSGLLARLLLLWRRRGRR